MEKNELLELLEDRFNSNKARHKNIEWQEVLEKLEANPERIESLMWMEETGGQPDLVSVDGKRYLMYVDMAKESPTGRRSLCYDKTARINRKKNPPKNSAMELAKEKNLMILNKSEYRNLQNIEKFDLKTSSWIKTPKEMRKLGGALFCDNRYDRVFTYHNGAESYYASRGFRVYFLI